ncbi:hypothetical protein CBR_g37411 [Chara braunii]|uniref:transaldolase n=1 Tax=Chara braunii TaxID=69332 RepID=A0A388LMR0_CHABU|nr:hypothetical protein CBR_g37411 [Chara braunii]|eukprot:GBG83607.1 hypothetical protein CBR_g37411 [Chara braunii]
MSVAMALGMASPSCVSCSQAAACTATALKVSRPAASGEAPRTPPLHKTPWSCSLIILPGRFARQISRSGSGSGRSNGGDSSCCKCARSHFSERALFQKRANGGSLKRRGSAGYCAGPFLLGANANRSESRLPPLACAAALGSPVKAEEEEQSTNVSELDAVSAFSEIVPDTVIADDFDKFPLTAATVSSALLTGILGLPGSKYKGCLDSALVYGKCMMEEDEKKRISCFVEKALVNVGAALAKEVSGRVSTDVDARLADDSRAIIDKVRSMLKLYGEMQIPLDRLLFRLPATWQGIEAARQLEADGIQTHVTLVYSFVQAAACADAGVSVIQLYVGRARDWARSHEGDPEIAAAIQTGQDPGVALVTRAYNYVHKKGYNTKIMAAAIRNKQDVLSLLGCDYLIVPVKVLQSLKDAPADLDSKFGFERRLSPSAARATQFPAMEKLDQESFLKQLGPYAEQMLKQGLESYSRASERVEESLARIWPPPNM